MDCRVSKSARACSSLAAHAENRVHPPRNTVNVWIQISHAPLTIAQSYSNRYSRQTRQRIAKRAWEEDWEHKHRILIVDNTNKTEKSYSELMASSIFCLAIIGAWKDGGWETDCFYPLAITGVV